jgi:hypothetical protein
MAAHPAFGVVVVRVKRLTFKFLGVKAPHYGVRNVKSGNRPVKISD